ncbi:hypothetical protein CEXT_287211 [Caerostris extrusa]|uniref:Ribosomal protein S14 n=1 Tax=Caerostris extrusa TaxID=172846 RepID=A0AAV4NW58_CAEEX|nr:hypothetical protein CEXT_287211 [Caerostris extrusa]
MKRRNSAIKPTSSLSKKKAARPIFLFPEEFFLPKRIAPCPWDRGRGRRRGRDGCILFRISINYRLRTAKVKGTVHRGL